MTQFNDSVSHGAALSNKSQRVEKKKKKKKEERNERQKQKWLKVEIIPKAKGEKFVSPSLGQLNATVVTADCFMCVSVVRSCWCCAAQRIFFFYIYISALCLF